MLNALSQRTQNSAAQVEMNIIFAFKRSEMSSVTLMLKLSLRRIVLKLT
jgi:hypothetical protein